MYQQTDLTPLFLGLIIFITITFAIGVYRKTHQQAPQPTATNNKPDITQDQYERMLTQLLNANIIDFQQYNQLLVKGLPYFK